MAPAATSELPLRSAPVDERFYPEPLKLSGALDKFEYEDTTPILGREFLNVNIVEDLLNSADSEDLLRDLAINSNTPRHTYITHAENIS